MRRGVAVAHGAAAGAADGAAGDEGLHVERHTRHVGEDLFGVVDDRRRPVPPGDAGVAVPQAGQPRPADLAHVLRPRRSQLQSVEGDAQRRDRPPGEQPAGAEDAA